MKSNQLRIQTIMKLQKVHHFITLVSLLGIHIYLERNSETICGEQNHHRIGSQEYNYDMVTINNVDVFPRYLQLNKH